MVSTNNKNFNIWGKEKASYRIGLYSIMAVIFLAVHFLLELKIFDFWEKYLPLLKKLSITLFLIFVIFLIGKFIEKLISEKSKTEGTRYNLIRITRVLSSFIILIVLVSFLSQSFGFAIASLGLASLILGFALQVPILNFIGWIYIVTRTPFQVGDRIQIGNYKGDVIKIDYLDTLMLEFGGDYLSNDRSSGRVISFPNSNVFKTEIFNYSGPFAPFIWNETAIQIAYNSDIAFVQNALMESAEEDFEERYDSLSNEIMERWKPNVYFRVNTYAWLEAVVSYPVKPVDTTTRRTGILKRALQKLNANPERALLPKGTER